MLGALESDKAAHFGVAAAAQLACTAVAKNITDNKTASNIGCFIAVNAVGVGKEMLDKGNGGDRDVKDVYANLLGSGFTFTIIQLGF